MAKMDQLAPASLRIFRDPLIEAIRKLITHSVPWFLSAPAFRKGNRGLWYYGEDFSPFIRFNFPATAKSPEPALKALWKDTALSMRF